MIISLLKIFTWNLNFKWRSGKIFQMYVGVEISTFAYISMLLLEQTFQVCVQEFDTMRFTLALTEIWKT